MSRLFVGDRPKLYESDEKDFTGNGFGYLSDGISCRVTEELNTSFELLLQYPSTGILFNELKINRIITARPNPSSSKSQPFRIYRITKSINDIISVYAAHISYDLAGYINTEINTEHKEEAADIDTLFSFMNSISSAFAEQFSAFNFLFTWDGNFEPAEWSVPSPTDLKTLMRNAVAWFGGQWEFDKTNCILHERRGEDRATVIEYGKNLTDFSEDADNSEVYTHVMPYYVKEDDTIIGDVDHCVETGAPTNGFYKIMPLDLTREFEEVKTDGDDDDDEEDTAPTEQELLEKAREYLAENSIGNITITQNVSFVNRGQTIEYHAIGDLDRVDIGDTVKVKVLPLGIETSAICKRTVYEVYLKRYEVVEIGELNNDIVSTIAELSAKENNYPALYVDDEKPTTKKIKAGDYWIKINDEVNRYAQALGKYTGGKWVDLCEIQSGGTNAPYLFVQSEEPVTDKTKGIVVVDGDLWIKTDENENAKTLYRYIIDPEDESKFIWDELCDFAGSGGEAFNVFVSHVEPVESESTHISEGDYWIETQSASDPSAKALYRYIVDPEDTDKFIWNKICTFRNGVGENVGQHNERFNDYENNIIGGTGDYNHVEGQSNKIYNGYQNHVTGQSNTLSSGTGNFIGGGSNIIGYPSNYSTVLGYNNRVNVGSLYSSLLQGYAITIQALSGGSPGQLTYCLISGSNHVITSGMDNCTVFGSSNKINSSVTSSIIAGSGNTVGGSMTAGSIIAGDSNSISGNFPAGLITGSKNSFSAVEQSIICGHENSGSANRAFICGAGANVNTDMRIGVGNGSAASPSNCFVVKSDGNVYASGSYNAMGADYAEYFEWIDGNPENEDRRGMLVSLESDKIVLANGDDIFGIISASPSVVGNSESLDWRGKYKRDIFGAIIYDEEGKPILSDDYDNGKKYIPRSERSEWAAVGFMGRLIVTDNGKCTAGGYVTARKGIAHPIISKTNVRVLKRIDSKHIEVFIK